MSNFEKFHKVTLTVTDERTTGTVSITIVRDDAEIERLTTLGYTITRKWTVVGPRKSVEGWS